MDEITKPEITNETKPSRGDPVSAAWFRDTLAELGETRGGLAKLMKRCGDDRAPATILRFIQRMAAGDARISGEMRVILHSLRKSKVRRARLALRANKTAQTSAAPPPS